jgi:hypothetical protein
MYAVEQCGSMDAKLLPAPVLSFSNVEECGNTLAAAGFDQVTLAEASPVWRFPAPDDFFDGISPITVRTAALLCGQTAENLSRIRATAEDEARNYSLADGTVEFARAPRQHTQILRRYNAVRWLTILARATFEHEQASTVPTPEWCGVRVHPSIA